MPILNRVLVAAFVALAASTVQGASLDKADMLDKHGLLSDAKRELIDVYFGPDPKAKAQALYLLGALEFRDNNVTAAMHAWRELATRFPKSEQAALVADRLKQLAEIVQDVSKSSAENAVAQSYISHGDFWSSKKRERFTIDSSWLPRVEMAIAWYDRVLKEFPRTTAARIAHEQKIRTLLGWEDGRAEKEGVAGDFATYMPQLLASFTAFEADFPDAGSLQAFRFQIAQVFWKHRDWAGAKQWLSVIVEKAGTEPSFYRDLADRRLQRLEY